MSRNYIYQKNSKPLFSNPPRLSPRASRGQTSTRRGQLQQLVNRSSNEYGTRDRYNSSRSFRGNRGFNQWISYYQRDDLNNNRLNKDSDLHIRADEKSFKVTIPHGDKYDQTYLMNLLRENISHDLRNFVFYNFQKIPGSAVFYVIGTGLSETLRNLSRRLNTYTGHRLVILTQSSSLPWTILDERIIGTIREAMSRLYDPNTRVMNLSKFRDADEFKQQGVFLVIERANVIRTIVQIITEFAPNLLALNLRDNKLNFLEMLRPLSEKCTSLKAIDLSDNKIHNFNEISQLRGLDLVEVLLTGNPFVTDFPTQASYVSSVRKIFNNLKKLDNDVLPSEIGFDLGESYSLPETRNHFIPEPVCGFVEQFLDAFYKIYDSDSRQGLMQAYHESATFTYSYVRNDHQLHKFTDQVYKESHNILRLRDESQWVKFVKTNSIDAVSLMCKFPSTNHDRPSFHVDVPFYDSTFVILVVNGLFNELRDSKNLTLRSFCRTFCIVPQGQGFVIVNDMLQIANLSSRRALSQDRTMRDVSQPSSLANSPQCSTSTASLPPSPTVASQKETIILRFMHVTNMNRQFSTQCLQENNFDTEAAYGVFLKLQGSNMIPAEAFI